ncbi:hypothetical protein PV08_11581 [Exophiala spinifera]|uniref:Uncharacterized protein n=1 Tax=Exophiala spinifera TaxID=91928 RepID=A0A0D1ZC73_9EURO|nr:uncharacterized protein PV08_11581 [Exophiala spinifera]KIW10617.1 hypothetical protein PV08_11581 [Exophiala spinifera]
MHHEAADRRLQVREASAKPAHNDAKPFADGLFFVCTGDLTCSLFAEKEIERSPWTVTRPDHRLMAIEHPAANPRSDGRQSSAFPALGSHSDAKECYKYPHAPSVTRLPVSFSPSLTGCLSRGGGSYTAQNIVIDSSTIQYAK